MKNTSKRAIATLLATLLLTSLLAACNQNGNNGDDRSEAQGNNGFVYIPEYISVDEKVTDMQNMIVVGDRLVFSSSTYDDERNESVTKLYSMSFDGDDLQELENYSMDIKPEGAPENTMGSMYINGMYSDIEENIWILENGYFYFFDLPDDYDPDAEDEWGMYAYYQEFGNTTIVRRLDNTGAEIMRIDLKSLEESVEYFWVNGMSIDDDLNVYISVQQSIFVFDKNGNRLFSLDIIDWVDRLFKTSDGSVAYMGWSQEYGGRVLQIIDISTRSLGEAIPIPNNAYNIYPGIGKYDFVHSNGISLMGFVIESGENEELLNWVNDGIDADNLMTLVMLPEDKIMFATYNWDYTGMSSRANFEIAILSKVPADSIPPKTILTLACYGLDWNIRRVILNYNKTNLEYGIHVNDYSTYALANDYYAGLTRLNTEIISGDIPDMILTSNLPIARYGARGLLEDLYPYIDADPDYNRTKLVEGVLRAAELDGKLYQIFPSYYIFSVWGNPNVLGYDSHWSMEEFNQVIMDNPQATSPMGFYLDRNRFIYLAVYMGMDRYIDWANGTANFETDEFIGLLEYALTIPDEIEYDYENWVSEDELIKNGQQIMRIGTIYDFMYPLAEYATFGGDLVFKGFPTNNDNGHTISMTNGISMTSACKDKEAAWNFMRDVLADNDTSDYNAYTFYSYGFPINKAAFDRMLDGVMTQEYYTDTEGNEIPVPKIGIYPDGGWTYFDVDYYGYVYEYIKENGAESYYGMNYADFQYIYVMTQEQADQILEIFDTVNVVSGVYDESLMEIIQEGAESFFNGRAIAADAARVIQSRVSIYIAEQS
ncbi:MAG: hypothetical protein FWG88_01990 [Oscillospiraceae bacterium]|nr:hypothetical protein [Oscillospiraceae bacterium]